MLRNKRKPESPEDLPHLYDVTYVLRDTYRDYTITTDNNLTNVKEFLEEILEDILESKGYLGRLTNTKPAVTTGLTYEEIADLWAEVENFIILRNKVDFVKTTKPEWIRVPQYREDKRKLVEKFKKTISYMLPSDCTLKHIEDNVLTITHTPTQGGE